MIPVGRVALLGATLTTTFTLTVADAAHAHSSANVDVAQTHVLAVDAATHGHTADNLTLSGGGTIVVAAADHGHTAGSPTLTQLHVVAVDDAVHASTSTVVTLTQLHVLANIAAVHTHSADNITLTIPGGGGAIIGYDTIGPNTDTTASFYGNQAYVTGSGLTHTAASGDTVTEVAIYGSGAGAHGAVGIYTVTAGMPVTLVGTEVSVAFTATAGWRTAATSIALTAGVEYTTAIRFWVDSSYVYNWDGTGSVQMSQRSTPGALPATWTHENDDTGLVSFYATVTAGVAPITLTVAGGAHDHTADQAALTTGGSLTVAGAAHTHTSANVTLTQAHSLGVDASFHAHSGGVVLFSGGAPYPVAVSSRKLLDQSGNVYLLKGMSSWAMGQNCSDAEITEALEGLATRGFNAVIASPCGVNNPGGTGWAPYLNNAGQPFFTGAPFVTNTAGSGFGPGWNSADWMMSEAARLGITVVLAVFVSWGSTGSSADLISAGTTNCYNFGFALATRYAAYRNIVWHVEGDVVFNAGDPIGRCLDAYFHGIVDAEGSTHRLIVAEPDASLSTYQQFISQEGTAPSGYQWFHVDINGPARGVGNVNAAVDQTDAAYNEAGATSEAIWADEAIYVHASYYSGIEYQQVREKNYATFLRGGVGINFGNEYWWPHGAPGLFGGTVVDWLGELDDPSTLQAFYCWTLLDSYCTNATFVPTSAFVTTGLGSGDTKAAAGASGSAALAYFPDNRTVIVDTTILSGLGNVRLRWYDPTAGTFTTIAASEAQNPSRGVTLPAAHGDGARDWVLVADLAASASTDLTVANGLHAHSAANIALTQTHALTVAAAAHGHVAGEPTVVVGGIDLTVASASHAHTADNLAPTTVTDLVVLPAHHAHTADTVALAIIVDLTPADAAHDHTATTLTLVVGGTMLVVADPTHGHTATTIAFVQGHQLAVNDTHHGHTARNITLVGEDAYQVPGTHSTRTLTAMAEPFGMTSTDTSLVVYRVSGDEGDAVAVTLTLGGDEDLSIADGAEAHVTRFGEHFLLPATIEDPDLRRVRISTDGWLNNATPGSWAVEVSVFWGGVTITYPSQQPHMRIVVRPEYG